jgi:ubiquinone/menaquinone biosynthesis C-methylase UbiE
MTEHEPWQLDGTAAELYDRYLVPAITSLWAADLIARAMPQPGERVLDVACGTGVVARLAAERMGSGRAAGLDINGGMLAVARSHAPIPGVPIEWHEASVLSMPFAEASFDLILCQLGLQFFPDRPAALREMHRVLAPSGRLALSVYSAIEHTPAARALADALDRHLGPGASAIKRSEHVFADADALCQLITGAGFRDVVLQTVTQTIRFTSPREYVRLQIGATPMADLVAGMDGVRRQALVDAIAADLIAALTSFSEKGELASPQEAYVVLARR